MVKIYRSTSINHIQSLANFICGQNFKNIFILIRYTIITERKRSRLEINDHWRKVYAQYNYSLLIVYFQRNDPIILKSKDRVLSCTISNLSANRDLQPWSDTFTCNPCRFHTVDVRAILDLWSPHSCPWNRRGRPSFSPGASWLEKTFGSQQSGTEKRNLEIPDGKDVDGGPFRTDLDPVQICVRHLWQYGHACWWNATVALIHNSKVSFQVFCCQTAENRFFGSMFSLWSIKFPCWFVCRIDQFQVNFSICSTSRASDRHSRIPN